ncbi:MAG TPA: hypothetical protein VFG38_02680 [Pseudomonadales bacterium]|nr:hypothetical protein [Pseudomonadales bacterium]
MFDELQGDAGMKKWTLRVLGAIVAVATVLFIGQIVASESGEVVKVTTVDGSGGQHETHLWIVDYDGHSWLRSGSPKSGWYSRLKETPTLDLERNGEHTEYTITVVPSEVGKINALMHEKYRWADTYIGFFISRANAVAIRLDPRPPEA